MRPAAARNGSRGWEEPELSKSFASDLFLSVSELELPRLVHGPIRIPLRTDIREPLLVEGDVIVEPGCRIHAPLYATGVCEVGRQARVGKLTARCVILGPRARARAIRATSYVDLRPNSCVEGPVDCDGPVRLAPGCLVHGIRAPEVETWPDAEQGPLEFPRIPDHAILVGPPSQCASATSVVLAKFPNTRWKPFQPNSWLVEGDLNSPEPLVVQAVLIVTGAFRCEGPSLIECSILSASWMSIGPGSIIRADLSAGGDLYVGRSTVLLASLRAVGDVRLDSGARGISAGQATEVQARGCVRLSRSVCLQGPVVGGKGVYAVEATRHSFV